MPDKPFEFGKENMGKSYSAYDLASAYPPGLLRPMLAIKWYRKFVWHWYYLNPFFWVAMFFVGFACIIMLGFDQNYRELALDIYDDYMFETRWEYTHA